MTVAPPEPLTERHDVDGFRSGVPSLDTWLKRRALANQVGGASRTFVVCEDDRVLAYYALASGSIATNEATGRFRRNMPEPIPVVALGRLAVDERYRARGFGRGLVGDAAKRVIAAGDAIGIRGLIVHAISAEARAFYLAIGFMPSPLDEMTLMIPLADVRKSL